MDIEKELKFKKEKETKNTIRYQEISVDGVVVIGLVYIQKNFLPVKIPDEINKKNVQDKWFAIDKVQHFSYSCLIALGSQYVLVNKGGMEEDSALPLSAGFSLFTGILKEILDSRNPKGFFSRKDLIADSLGIVLAVAIIFQPGKE